MVKFLTRGLLLSLHLAPLEEHTILPSLEVPGCCLDDSANHPESIRCFHQHGRVVSMRVIQRASRKADSVGGTEVDTKSPGNAKTRLTGAFQGLQVSFEVTGDP